MGNDERARAILAGRSAALAKFRSEYPDAVPLTDKVARRLTRDGTFAKPDVDAARIAGCNYYSPSAGFLRLDIDVAIRDRR